MGRQESHGTPEQGVKLLAPLGREALLHVETKPARTDHTDGGKLGGGRSAHEVFKR
jgi:hypothetical protein